MGDGTILVANAGTNEIRFYDRDGRHVRSVGGAGSGPGEFRRLAWIDLMAGDTILAFDHGSRQLSVFTPDGEFVRALTLEDHGRKRFPDPIAPFPDGSLLVRLGRVYGPDEVKTGTQRPEIAFVRYSAAGTFVDSLAVLPGDESYIIEGDGIITFQPPLLGRTTGAAVSGNGVYLGASDSFDIHRYGPDGRLDRRVRRRGGLRPATAADIERMRDERLSGLPEGPFRRFEERVVRELPARESHPAFLSFQADEAGHLWIEESRLPWESPFWTVFDPEGRLLGSLAFPDSFRPTDFGDDFVLGVARDELGVDRVRLYELLKP
jgi:hypothetical protein